MQAALTHWERPSHYAGFSPDGDILVLTLNRDSDALSRTNWDAAARRLIKVGAVERVESIDGNGWDGPPRHEIPMLYTWSASHFLCGWVQYLMVRGDAPEALIDEAQAIADDLAAYPALDEDAWSQLEWEEAQDYWASLPVRERGDLIKEWAPEVSIFAARRDYIPEDDSGALFDVLRG